MGISTYACRIGPCCISGDMMSRRVPDRSSLQYGSKCQTRAVKGWHGNHGNLRNNKVIIILLFFVCHNEGQDNNNRRY